ncbi:MAG: HAMP domain-containing histidine kinase [Bacteroidales bacterium]|nr:HAMP domain-containing histidine kinase [Bacteroidales bacterium]
MKLLNKINRTYLLSSLIVVIPGLVIAYFLIIFISSEETSEILHGNEQRVVQQIGRQQSIPDFYPLIDVQKVERAHPFEMKDTVIYNPVSRENEAFKEYTTYRIIGTQTYRITVRTPVIEKNDVVASLFLGTALLFLVILTVLYLINKNINHSIWLPFYSNLKAIKSFSLQSSEKLALQQTDISEFNDLNTQVIKLTNKVISDYNSLKEFTENAAHELQTPLSVVQAKVEFLFNQDTLTRKEMAALEIIMDNLQRLRRLNQSLLLLTKIENAQFDQRIPVFFNDFIGGILDSMKEMFEMKNINISLRQEGKFTTSMDLQLARQLISNLTSNILRHTPENGTAQIRIENDKITFSNSGTKPLNPDRIFKRFYKEGQTSTSTGLGLSIVQTICLQNNLSIRYHFSENDHYFVVSKEES